MTIEYLPEDKLKKPLFDHIAIKPAGFRLCAISAADDMGPPGDAVEISTYSVELRCLPPTPATPKEREKFRERVARLLYKLHEPLDELPDNETRHGHTDPYENWSSDVLKFASPVTMDWQREPPVAIAHGLTLDMLEGLVELNMLAPSLEVAKAFEAAARVEYRGPFMALDEGASYDPTAGDYARSNSAKQGTNIGDFGALPPEQQYEGAVKQLKTALAHKLIGKDEFARAVTFVADTTLKGLMLSPYPQASHLLADKSFDDSDSGRAAMLKQRIEKVVSDVIGPEQALVWNPTSKDASKHGLGAHATRIKQEMSAGGKDYDEQSVQDSIARAQAALKQGQDALVINRLTGNIAQSLLKLKLEAHREAQGSKALAARESASPTHGLDWERLTFFGVKAPISQYYAYQSRNPLIDPPRPLHPALQEALDRETRQQALREKHKGAGNHTRGQG